jgi:small subunit ribosomal protein S11
MNSPKKETKRKQKTPEIKKVNDGKGYINIFSSFNNNILNVSRENGEVLGKQVSCGSSGFRGSKKSTAYAAQKAAQNIISAAQKFGVSNVSLKVRGIGPGRNVILREIIASNVFQVNEIIDMTGNPFSHGVRARKKPRK